MQILFSSPGFTERRFAYGESAFPTKDGLFVEKADSPYANLLSVNPGDENKPAIQKLAKALQSPEVKKFIEEHYKGAIIPAF